MVMQSRWLILAGVLAPAAQAESAPDSFFASVEVSGAASCGRIDLRFNQGAALASNVPASIGTELAIPLTGFEAAAPEAESADVALDNAAGLSLAKIEGGAIRLTFASPSAFRVVMDKGSRHMRVDVAAAESAKQCLGIADETPPEKPVAAVTPASADAVAAGKEALAAKDFARAIALFTKAANGTGKQEAQELLGLAHERAGQLAHAKAVYGDYLKRYPKGADAARVKTRLDGVVASMSQEAEVAFAAKKKTALAALPQPKPQGTRPAQAEYDALKARIRERAIRTTPVKDPLAWEWEGRAGFGAYYYRDDEFNRDTGHDTVLNEVVTSGHVFLRAHNRDNEFSLRAEGVDEQPLGSGDKTNLPSLYTAYIDARNNPSGVSARLGRQSVYGDGVFGRYDGALLGFEFMDGLKLESVVGSPVYSRKDPPFADNRFFYGLALNYERKDDPWAGGVYALEQRVESVLDRRAIGAEARYSGEHLSAWTASDFDTYYRELNNASLSLTWTFDNGASVYGAADYRHVPFLVTSNALIGQDNQNLSALDDLLGTDTLVDLAADRTARSVSASAGFSYPLSKHWQFAADANVVDYSGTPASGGVDAIPDPGTEFYFSGYLTGSGLLSDNDLAVLGLRFSETSTYREYLADLSARFPLTENLRAGPRLRAIYRDAKDGGPAIRLMPSFNLKYRMGRHWSFETEAGLRWAQDRGQDGKRDNTDVLFTAGYRYEF